jgi:hypothetical protein
MVITVSCENFREHIMLNNENMLDDCSKNNLLKHISTCDECMEVFQLFDTITTVIQFPYTPVEDFESCVLAKIQNINNRNLLKSKIKAIFISSFFSCTAYISYRLYMFLNITFNVENTVKNSVSLFSNMVLVYSNVIYLNISHNKIINILFSTIRLINPLKYAFILIILVSCGIYHYFYQKNVFLAEKHF